MVYLPGATLSRGERNLWNKTPLSHLARVGGVENGAGEAVAANKHSELLFPTEARGHGGVKNGAGEAVAA